LTLDQAAIISTNLLDLIVLSLMLFYITLKQQFIAFIKKMQVQDGVENAAAFLRKIVYDCTGLLFGNQDKLV
jgi:hypothetical protein